MKHKRSLWKSLLLAVLALFFAACAWEFISSQNPYLLPVKRALKYNLLRMTTVDTRRETAGLSDGYRETFFRDGVEDSSDAFDRRTDQKRVYEDGVVTRLVNYLDGYQLDFPAGTTFDFSLSPLLVRGDGDGFDVTVSREKANYQSLKDAVTFELSTFAPFLFHDNTVQDFVQHYEYRFLLNPQWQSNNQVTVLPWTDEAGTYFIRATVAGLEPGQYDEYLYVTFYTASREYLRVMFRYDQSDDATRDRLIALVSGARVFSPVGQGHFDTHYAPDTEGTVWDAETQALYNSFGDFSTPPDWGIFLQDFYVNGFDKELVALEQSLDYTFPVVLYYRHLPTHKFPTEVMQENYEAGRLVELTLQLTANNNEDMLAASPALDICRGNLDQELRAWARAAAEFGHPFLFRLDNEMNSDWTSYGGVVNLCDPELFINVWQRVFRIFQEEGADNCIWIFNPNDRQAPPSKWNNSLAYYPGNEYVHMIGVTGYNNGTYYTKWAEEWREFTTIYDLIWEEYSPHFSAFPWIITEFASSGVGGDKVAWIERMFDHIADYPNIRIAVWFSHADFDDANGGVPARTYWLDETPETLDAFRRGLEKQFKNGG